MGLLGLPIPTLGQPNMSEDADVRNSLVALQNEINGLLDAANIEDGSLTATELETPLVEKLGVTAGGSTRRGKSIIATEESRANTAYGVLATPDRVSNLVLPTDGLIVVGYQALWKESVIGAARAAIFIGANQLTLAAVGTAAPTVTESSIGGTNGDVYGPLATSGAGLVSRATVNNVQHATQWTTGQAVGVVPASGVTAGPVYIFAAAGTYDVSVQFKASSGSVTAKERKLWAWTIGF